MNAVLRWIFFNGVVRPLVMVVIGLNVRNRERLPQDGPAIIVANHNSHLDTLVLMTLFPRRLLGRLRPIAAADYFLANRWLAWFALDIMGILPIARTRAGGGDPLAGVAEALGRGEIVLLYPEGSRGEPEQLQTLKNGIAHLAKRFPEVPVIPVYLHGLGKALPKGEALLVPFFCDVFVGDPLSWGGNRGEYMAVLESRLRALGEQGRFPAWQ